MSIMISLYCNSKMLIFLNIGSNRGAIDDVDKVYEILQSLNIRVLVIIVLGHLDHIPHVVVKNKVNNNYTAFQYKGSSLIGEDFISPLFDWSPI